MARKGQGILLVYTDLSEPKYEEEFNAWYNTEHLPELLAIPGVLDAARYVATKGGPKYLAAYELASVDVLQAPEFKNRPRTPWGQRVGPTAIGKNRARIVSGSRSSRVVWRTSTAVWPQHYKLAVCQSLTAWMPSGTPGTTASTSLGIAKSRALFMHGVTVSLRVRSATLPCMNSSMTRSPKVPSGITSVSTRPRIPDACARP
jgi:hypothetical protein